MISRIQPHVESGKRFVSCQGCILLLFYGSTFLLWRRAQPPCSPCSNVALVCAFPPFYPVHPANAKLAAERACLPAVGGKLLLANTKGTELPAESSQCLCGFRRLADRRTHTVDEGPTNMSARTHQPTEDIFSTEVCRGRGAGGESAPIVRPPRSLSCHLREAFFFLADWSPDNHSCQWVKIISRCQVVEPYN